MFQALRRAFGLERTDTADAHALYGKVVARSRAPFFYMAYGVPDTLDGRFEVLAMHLFLLTNRLKDEDPQARAVSQAVFDAFIDDMDAALREAAVGDQTVPKRIVKMTRVFYGRTGAYEKALASGDSEAELTKVMGRNLVPETTQPQSYRKLARYVMHEAERLRAAPVEAVLDGSALFEGEPAT